MSEIQIKRIKVLSGANIWAYRPVLEILTDIGKYEQLPSNKIEGFTERLVEAIPTLWEHRCSEGRPGGFLERMRIGTYMGHILEHVILELQSLAGMDVGFGRTRQTEHYGQYRIVVDYRDPEAGKMCAYLAAEIAEKLAEVPSLKFEVSSSKGQPETSNFKLGTLNSLGIDLAKEVEEIRDEAESNMLGPSTQAIIEEARKRGIPWFRLNRGALVQLGHGRYARRIQASETSFTSNIGVEIASDKSLTKDLLAKVGVPVPQGEVVRSVDGAWDVARSLGGPVVVKPEDGNQGKAVSVNLTTEEQVRTAFELAREISRGVIVEQYLTGSDFRLLVVNGKLVAAAQRLPAQVVADGLHNVRHLVKMVNEDPRRGQGHGSALTRIRMDAAAELTLAKQELDWESVPGPGQVVLLRDNSNLSTGGTATDVTDEVHPDNAALAVLAAETIGLDIAGVDVVCENIKRPLYTQGGGVVEVNAAPGLRMHVYPSEGKSRPVGQAIVNMLFPTEDRRQATDDGRRTIDDKESSHRPSSIVHRQVAQARVPLIAITGTNGKTTVTRMIGHVYATMKKFVGMTTTDGIYFNGVRRVKGDCSGPKSAEAVLQHPRVEVAVLETARGGILRSGLAWDESTVSVVLNVASDHLGLEGIETPERLARVKRVPLESVSREGYGVLNADDPLVADMAPYCPGEVIFFSMSANGPVMASHLANNAKGVFLRDGQIIFAEGAEETLLMRASDVPATYGGIVPFQIQNALSAAAACWGAGVPLDSIRLGLRTFQTDETMTPGRFNVFNVGRVRVIIDYGHNPHALRAIQAAISHMQPRRTIGVVAAPGDRRDADIQELAVVAAHTFDWIIVREDDDMRGREPGEVAHLIAETIARTRPSLPLSIITDEAEAVDQALEMARAGDLVVVFVDRVDETIEQVKAAAQTLEMEQSESFWVPLQNPALEGSRRRTAPLGLSAAQQDDVEEAGQFGNGAVPSSNGRQEGEEVALPRLSDGEADEPV